MPKVITPIYLEQRDVQELRLIEGTELLSVAFNRGDLTMYGVADTDVEARQTQTIRIKETGVDVSDLQPGKFLGTVVGGVGGKTLHVWADYPRKDGHDV